MIISIATRAAIALIDIWIVLQWKTYWARGCKEKCHKIQGDSCKAGKNTRESESSGIIISLKRKTIKHLWDSKVKGNVET